MNVPSRVTISSRTRDASQPWDERFLYREIKEEAQSAVDEFLDRHRETPRSDP